MRMRTKVMKGDQEPLVEPESLEDVEPDAEDQTPTGSVTDEISRLLDEDMLQQVRAGGLSAAKMNAIRQRLKDLGVNTDASNAPSGAPVKQLMQEIRDRGWRIDGKIPDLRDERDEATG